MPLVSMGAPSGEETDFYQETKRKAIYLLVYLFLHENDFLNHL